MTENDSRGNFGSKLGVILASAGSAVGLGNIWRFPYETGQNGGAAFLLIYLICVVFFGLPVMWSEFLIGRRAKANTMRAYLTLAPGTKWFWVGIMGVMAGFLILSYYCVVAGWTLEYLIQASLGHLSGKTPEIFSSEFSQFIASPWKPLVYMAIFMLLTHFIIVRGVKDGIEKSAKMMMPMLFVLLIILAIRSVTLPGGEEGLRYLFHPDFSKITSSVLLSAMGQAFFSLSLGMGALCTYASYFSKDTNLLSTGIQVTFLDSLVAILAGLVIFPAVFAFGVDPGAGPGLVFVTLPNVFQHMTGGYFWAIMFYLLLVVAALTSTISLHEVATAYVHEELKISRSKAASYVTGTAIFLGIFCSLAYGVLSDYTLFGLNAFDFMDYITAKIMLPIGGLCISIFTGWYLDKNILWEELSNDSKIKFRLFGAYVFIIKYIAPIIITLIFFKEIGII